MLPTSDVIILPERYNFIADVIFIPLICDFACYQNVPVADSLAVAGGAERIPVLPIYYDLKLDECEKIYSIIQYIGRV